MKAMQVLKNKKGFTLIEIIVVLIILAILAAAGIPSMIGFIEDSREKAMIAEARVGFVAAQVVLTEEKAKDSSYDQDDLNTAIAVSGGRFQKLVAGTKVDGFKDVTISGDQVTGITYTKDSKTVTIP